MFISISSYVYNVSIDCPLDCDGFECQHFLSGRMNKFRDILQGIEDESHRLIASRCFPATRQGEASEASQDLRQIRIVHLASQSGRYNWCSKGEGIRRMLRQKSWKCQIHSMRKPRGVGRLVQNSTLGGIAGLNYLCYKRMRRRRS